MCYFSKIVNLSSSNRECTQGCTLSHRLSLPRIPFHSPAQVEVLIDETSINSTTVDLPDVAAAYGFTAQDHASLPFLVSKRVYRLDAHAKLPADPTDVVGLDWLESAVARPDLVRPPAPRLWRCLIAMRTV